MTLRPSRPAWLTLGVAALVGFFMLFAILTVSPLVEFIITDLALSFAEAGLLFSVLVVMIVVGALVGGYVSDRLGIKRAAGIGAVLVGVGAPVRGVASSYLALLIFMALVGLGYGFLLPNLPKLAAGWFPRAYLGRVTGTYMASLYAGGAVGIVATIPLHQLLAGTWRTTLTLSGLLCAVAAVAWWLLARNPPAPLLAVSPGATAAKTTGRIWANGQLWLVALLVTTMNVFFYTLGGWLPTIFTERGSSPEAAGFLASLPYFLAIPATFVVPVLSDRVGRRKPFLWLLAGVAALASYGLLVTPLIWGGVLAAMLGFATAGILVVCYILPVELVEAATLGRASGFIISVGFLGGIVGPLLAGILRDLTQSFASVIVLLVLTAVSAGLLAAPLRETGRRPMG